MVVNALMHQRVRKCYLLRKPCENVILFVQGLGLSIVGRKSDVGVYVSDLVKGGVAEHDGRIMTGKMTIN